MKPKHTIWLQSPNDDLITTFDIKEKLKVGDYVIFYRKETGPQELEVTRRTYDFEANIFYYTVILPE
jgi:hypothetical protein